MSKTVVDADLQVFVPTNSGSTPDQTIPASDLKFARTVRRAQHSRDMGRFRIDNDGGSNVDNVDIGDRVTFRTQLEGEASKTARWTGLVRDLNFDVSGPTTRDMDVVCDDFVFGVLSIRYATFDFDDTQIAGTSDAIVDKLVTENAPEIGTGQIDPVTQTTTITFRRANLLEALVDLNDRAPVLMASDDTDLVFQPRSTPSVKFPVESTDRTGDWSSSLSDERLVNDIVVDGGTDTALDIQQTAADSFQTVTSTSRATQVVEVRKSDVAAIELDISPTGSGEAVIVRLQKNDGTGSPVDAASSSSDLARTRLESSELINGFNRFEFPSNDVPDPNPVVIVETDGSTGQDVAFDSGSGDLAYKVYYRFQVVASADDKDSIDDYRRHEARYRRESITNFDEAKQIATRVVAKRNDPPTTVQFEAASTRAHNLAPAEAVSMNEPDVRAEGGFLVQEVRDEFRTGRENRLTTTVSLQERTTI